MNTSWVRLQGWTCVLLIFFLHFIEDEWRVFTIFKFKAPDNFLYFAWDQINHFASIWVFFPLSTSAFINEGFVVQPSRTPASIARRNSDKFAVSK